MVTDRCSTAGLLMILSHLYPDELLVWTFLMVLDFSSHWYHMYASKGHHKEVAEVNVILQTFYTHYFFFGFCCVGTEFFYILMYIRAYVGLDDGSGFLQVGKCPLAVV